MDTATDNTNPAQIRPEDTRIKKVNRTMRLILINFQNTIPSSSELCGHDVKLGSLRSMF